jgi:hypothetical protein
LAFELNSQIAALQNQNWSESLWISHVAGSFANISATSLNIRQSNILGSQVAATVVTFSQPTSTLARVSGTATLSEVTTAFVTPGFRLTIANGAAIDITLRIGLPQLEQGAFSTSAIPTTTAAATRAADVAVMQGANFSNWYSQSEGTVFVSHAGSAGNASRRVFSINDGTINNTIQVIGSNGAGTQANYAEVFVGGVSQAQLGTGAYASGDQTSALAYKLNDIGFSKNGSAALTDSVALIPVVTQLQIGQLLGVFLNGHIRRLAFFPRRLADAELTSITS